MLGLAPFLRKACIETYDGMYTISVSIFWDPRYNLTHLLCDNLGCSPPKQRGHFDRRDSDGRVVGVAAASAGIGGVGPGYRGSVGPSKVGDKF